MSDEPKVRKCKFMLNLHTKCDEDAFYDSLYCIKHKEERCIVCNNFASHYCFESYNCEGPLCSNQFCVTHYNLKVKHTRTI